MHGYNVVTMSLNKPNVKLMFLTCMVTMLSLNKPNEEAYVDHWYLINEENLKLIGKGLFAIGIIF